MIVFYAYSRSFLFSYLDYNTRREDYYENGYENHPTYDLPV